MVVIEYTIQGYTNCENPCSEHLMELEGKFVGWFCEVYLYVDD